MLLDTQGLVYARFNEPLGEPLSCRIQGGEALCLRGPNGSGKSTLLRVLSGLIPATAGTLSRTDSYTYLSHQCALNEELSVWKNLTLSADLHGTPRHLVTRALSQLNLSPYGDWLVKTLSSGQRRRVALARVLSSNKRLWILDEPTTGLDDTHTKLFDTLIQEHIKTQGAVIFSSHQTHRIKGLKTILLEA